MSKLNDFIELFNSENYFTSHEVLEELWLTDKSKFNHLMFLIQIAAMQLHSKRRTLKGYEILLKKNLKNINRYKIEINELGIDWYKLKCDLVKCYESNIYNRFTIKQKVHH